MKDNCQITLKKYNVGIDKDGNIILYWGDNENDENGYYYIYNPKKNEMKESIGFNRNDISKNKQTYQINNYNSFLFPKNFKEDNLIYVMKKIVMFNHLILILKKMKNIWTIILIIKIQQIKLTVYL